MTPLVLCIHLPEEQVMRLSFLAPNLGIQLQNVPPAQWGQTLGALCGLDPRREAAPSVRLKDGMMVMAFFPDGLMDRWLQTMRTSGMPPIPLKAVLTAHNRGWNCAELCAALSREAMMLQKQKGAKP